jgi:hypothetical protein
MRIMPPAGRTEAGLLDLVVDGCPLGPIQCISADVYLAVDRPDRLEVRFISSFDGSWGELPPDLRPGKAIHASLAGRAVFEGTSDRVGIDIDDHRGRVAALVAYSEYHRRRFAGPWGPYYQTTDSEVAREVAAALGLIPIVDPTPAVHPIVRIEGDPLAHLRRRAGACGFHLGVCAGRLYFCGHLPEDREELSVDDPAGILSLGIADRGVERGGRMGKLTVRGDPRWKPLSRVRLHDMGPFADGVYDVVRVIHRLDGTTFQTTVEFLEGGLGFSASGGEEDDDSPTG